MTQLLDYEKDCPGKQNWESFNLDDDFPRGLPLWDDHIFQRLDIFDMQPIEVLGDFEFPQPQQDQQQQQGHLVDDLLNNDSIPPLPSEIAESSSKQEDEQSELAFSSENTSQAPATPTKRSYRGRGRRPKVNTKKSWACPTCGIALVRDFARHMRTHDEVARFQCPFPRDKCPHRTGQFNRQYDMKKHLLHDHFRLDRPSARRSTSLNEKLKETGKCHCGMNFTANEFLDHHVLANNVYSTTSTTTQQQTQHICSLLGANARPWKVKPGIHRASTRTLEWT